MVYEVLLRKMDPAKRDEYVALYKKRWREMSLDGWRSGRIYKCIEDPGRLIIVLEWDSVEAHRQHTRGRNPVMTKFMDEVVGPYRSGVSDIDHYTVEDL